MVLRKGQQIFCKFNPKTISSDINLNVLHGTYYHLFFGRIFKDRLARF